MPRVSRSAVVLAATALSMPVGALQSDCGTPHAGPIGLGSEGAAGWPTLALVGAPVPGHPLAFEVAGAAPTSPGILFVGSGPISVELPEFGATVYVTGPQLLAAFVTSSAGIASAIAPIANIDPSLCGAGAVLQAVVHDPTALGGFAFTQGLELDVGQPTGVPQFPVPTHLLAYSAAALASADFDRDGLEDLVALEGFGKILLFLASGSGHLEEALVVFDSVLPSRVEIADLDSDGLLDLVVLDRGFAPQPADDSVIALTGDGAGAFTVTAWEPLQHDARDVAVGEFDGDGVPDLAIAHGSIGLVSVWLGSGNGSFAPNGTFPVGGYSRAVATGDFDGDGHEDLAVAIEHPGRSVTVLLGQGAGTFGPPAWFGEGSTGGRVEVLDFDRDQVLDLLVLDERRLRLASFRGHGDGTFAGPIASGPIPGPVDLAVGDYDGDGSTDAVVVSEAGPPSPSVHVFRGTVSGAFELAQLVETGVAPRSVALGDLDGDGFPELMCSMHGPSQVRVHAGLGAEGFLDPQLLPPGAADQCRLVRADADALPDLVGLAGGVAAWHRGEGDGSFGPPLALDVAGSASAFATGDFDADGEVDLAFALPAADAVSILTRTGSAGFSAPAVYPAGASPSSVTVADLDGDGALDLVTENPGGGTVGVLLGLGGGAFGPAASFPSSTSPEDLELADANGDGLLDLLGLDDEEDHVWVLLATAPGTYAPPSNFTFPGFLGELAVGDVDADGIEDLVVTRSNSPSIIVREGLGNGVFGFPKFMNPGGIAVDAKIFDIDGDARLDLVVAIFGLGIAVLLGEPGGTLGPPLKHKSFPVAGADQSSTPEQFEFVDVDGDWIRDLVTTNATLGYHVFSVSPGVGDGTFLDPTEFATRTQPVTLEIGDLDGDGLVDFLTGGTVQRNRLLE